MEQKELQKHAYEKQINELFLNQSKAKEKLLQDHNLQKQQKDEEYRNKQQMIEKLERENIEKRKKIEEEAWAEIDELKDRNKEELSQQIIRGMKDKTLLQKETSLHREKQNTKQNRIRRIKDLNSQSRTYD